MGLKESGLRGSLRNVSVGIDAIPDSAIAQYPIEETGGDTFSDTLGDLADFTVSSNDKFVSDSEFQDGQKLDLTNDYANTNSFWSFEFDSNWSVGFTVVFDALSMDDVIFTAGNGNDNYRVGISRDSDAETIVWGSNVDGDFVNNSKDNFLSTNTKLRFLFGCHEDGTTELWSNASQLTPDGNEEAFAVQDDEVVIGAARSNGDNQSSIFVDNIIPYNILPNEDLAQQDFNVQPWS